MNGRENTGIRELAADEIEAVTGGVAPIIGMAVAFYGHFSARSVAASLAGRIGLALGTYSLAEWAHD